MAKNGGMTGVENRTRRCILGVFAHPDDETSGCAGTFAKYARQGVEVYVVTATRGERGELGTGGLTIDRENLPAVRENELRAVLELYGANPPILFGYRDQEVSSAAFEELVQHILAAMERTTPDVVITFGPSGISNHADHKAIHGAACEAFHRYRQPLGRDLRLYYMALPEDIARRFAFNLDATEMDVSVTVDITALKPVKVRALRMYRSQPDAQALADLFESNPWNAEWFHQAYPAVALTSQTAAGFWSS